MESQAPSTCTNEKDWLWNEFPPMGCTRIEFNPDAFCKLEGTTGIPAFIACCVCFDSELTMVPSESPSVDPSERPSLSLVCSEDSSAEILISVDENEEVKTKTCGWLELTSSPTEKERICGISKAVQNYELARDVCKVTCETCNINNILVLYYELTSEQSLPMAGLKSLTPFLSEQIATIEIDTLGEIGGSGRDDVSAMYQGTLIFDEIGAYELCVYSNNDAKLYLDGYLIIKILNLSLGPKCKVLSTINERAARRVSIEWANYGKDARLQLSWKTPSNPKELVIVPQEAWIQPSAKIVPPGTNIALSAYGAVATQSTSFDEITEAGLAIDGNYNGNLFKSNPSVAITSYELNAWWEVQLRDTFFISEVKVYNRKDCCLDRLVGFVLTIYDDNDVVYNSKESDPEVSKTTEAEYIFEIPNVKGNRVKIVLDDKWAFLQLAEVMVYTGVNL